jgi:hypothetical protein
MVCSARCVSLERIKFNFTAKRAFQHLQAFVALPTFEHLIQTCGGHDAVGLPRPARGPRRSRGNLSGPEPGAALRTKRAGPARSAAAASEAAADTSKRQKQCQQGDDCSGSDEDDPEALPVPPALRKKGATSARSPGSTAQPKCAAVEPQQQQDEDSQGSFTGNWKIQSGSARPAISASPQSEAPQPELLQLLQPEARPSSSPRAGQPCGSSGRNAPCSFFDTGERQRTGADEAVASSPGLQEPVAAPPRAGLSLQHRAQLHLHLAELLRRHPAVQRALAQAPPQQQTPELLAAHARTLEVPGLLTQPAVLAPYAQMPPLQWPAAGPRAPAAPPSLATALAWARAHAEVMTWAMAGEEAEVVEQVLAQAEAHVLAQAQAQGQAQACSQAEAQTQAEARAQAQAQAAGQTQAQARAQAQAEVWVRAQAEVLAWAQAEEAAEAMEAALAEAGLAPHTEPEPSAARAHALAWPHATAQTRPQLPPRPGLRLGTGLPPSRVAPSLHPLLQQLMGEAAAQSHCPHAGYTQALANDEEPPQPCAWRSRGGGSGASANPARPAVDGDAGGPHCTSRGISGSGSPGALAASATAAGPAAIGGASLMLSNAGVSLEELNWLCSERDAALEGVWPCRGPVECYDTALADQMLSSCAAAPPKPQCVCWPATATTAAAVAAISTRPSAPAGSAPGFDPVVC